MVEDREVIALVVSMSAKTGATSIYGHHDFEEIINAGCKVKGYKYSFVSGPSLYECKLRGKEAESFCILTITPKDSPCANVNHLG